MYRFIKRFLDILFSLFLLVILSPVFIVLFILIRIKIGSPIFFRQKRPGKDEEIFELIKFRSMTNEKDENGNLLPDRDRLTKFGKFLRKSSLDELPELWCILKGDMSFVGPRPLSQYYLPYYTEEESIRHNVRPGLTGLAQINGRNKLDWDERLKLDIEYVKTLSFINDVKIFLKTFVKVFKGSDVVVSGTGKVGNLDEIREVQRQEYVKK